MNTKTTIISTVVFIVLIASMFGYAFIKKQQLNEADNQVQPEENIINDRYSHITRVTAKHFYIDGVHTFAGEIVMPTPCDLLEAEAFVAESFPEQITIDFSVINNAEFCAETETPQRFKVSATASDQAKVQALFNDRVIELNLVPALEGETPDEFELYEKG
jgi:hypothetical protein